MGKNNGNGADVTAMLATLQAQLAAAQAENAALKAAGKASGSIKVSAKGAVSVYGLGRFPVTLYASQWAKLAERLPEVQAFIKAHASELSVKSDKDEAPAQGQLKAV